MSQVIMVNKFSGQYRCLDNDGKLVDERYSSYPLESRDADILMERIRQGYTSIAPGHYVVRAELTDPTEDCCFEIVDFITFELDDDGYMLPVTRKVITTSAWNDELFHNNVSPTSPSVKMAVFDFEASELKYVGDIFAENTLVSDPLKASTAQSFETERLDILYQAASFVIKDKPVHVMMVPIYFA